MHETSFIVCAESKKVIIHGFQPLYDNYIAMSFNGVSASSGAVYAVWICRSR